MVDKEIVNYVVANYKYKTVTFMSKEMALSTTQIKRIFLHKGITPPNDVEIIEPLLVKGWMKWKYIEAAAFELETSVKSVTDVVNKHKLPLLTKKKYETREKNKDKPDMNKSEAEIEKGLRRFAEAIGYEMGSMPGKPIKRPPAVYTQGGSPLMDEVHGVKTTGRPNTLLSNYNKHVHEAGSGKL